MIEQNPIMPDRRYWNILKGIGILCVVLGHACSWAHNFVYEFHIPLFFFISGFMYSEKKYGDDPYLNVINRFKSSWIKYVIIYWIIMLLHNSLIRWGFMPIGTEYFNLRTLAEACAFVVLGTANELMGGTLWFVPALCMASVFLGFLVTISRKIEKKTGNSYLKFAFQFVVILLCSLVGCIVISILMPANIQVSLTVMPFLWIGYLIRNYGRGLEKYLSVCAALILTLAIYFISFHHSLDLIIGILYPGMYLVAFSGMYVCMVLAKYLSRLKKIGSFIASCGKASFWIMAVHFPLIKIIDRIWAAHIGDPDRALYLTLPHSFDYMWPVYLLLGIGVPLLGYQFVQKKKSRGK